MSSADTPVFAATLTPHRSLGPQGVRLVLVLCCIATVVASVPFMVMGAWPIAGFFGLDMLALAIAFKVSVRSARGHERLVLTPAELCVSRVDARGASREWRFNPQWTRLEKHEDDEFGVQRLQLVSGRQRLVFGHFLGPLEKDSLHRALSEALVRARRGDLMHA